MSDIRDAAQAIAALVRAETSYVVDGCWTDSCALIRLADAGAEPVCLTVACGCADPASGCTCPCDTCRDCDEADIRCWSPWTCAEMATNWSSEVFRDQKMDTLSERVSACIAGVASGPAVTIRRARGNTPRCVLDPEGRHLTTTAFSAGVVHVAAHYVVAARRYAGVTSWQLVQELEGAKGFPALVGYAGTAFAALIMPLAFVGCKEAPP